MWLDYLYLTLIDRDCSKPQAKILTRVQIQLQATEKKTNKVATHAPYPPQDSQVT